MEPPLIPGPQTIPPPPTTASIDSTTNSWDEQPPQSTVTTTTTTAATKLRLMCSYGGHIIPRPHDKSLCYVGGDTRIFVTDRFTSLYDLSTRLSKTLLNNRPFWLKYQLPNEDLDSLISVTTDEDLENMIDEYDRVSKSSRIRLFLFTDVNNFDSNAGSSVLDGSTKSEEWFVQALNNGNSMSNSNKVFSESSSVNCLLGLDDDVVGVGVGVSNGNSNKGGGGKNVKMEVQSVPDSPMVETTSSFGSTSSTPSLANLPPIKVHAVEEGNNQNQRIIEEQFSQLGVGSKVEQSSPPAPVVAGTSVLPVVVGGGDYLSRGFSDDERSEQGVMGVGYRIPAQQQQAHQQQQLQQPQQKPAVPSELPSPNSVSSESSFTNPLSGQRHFYYQEQPGAQFQSGNNRVSANSVDTKMSDPNNRAQVQQQQVQDAAGYAMPVHYEQHPQMYQPQQYVHAGQYIQHTPSGPVPMTSYYPMYPSQQQTHSQHPALEQHQYPVYFVQSRPTQAYNLPVQQQSSYSESATTMPSNQPQTPPAPSMATPAAVYSHARNPPPASKPEMSTAGAYRTAAAAAPQLVQITSGQHQQQYVGYSQIHHPSQSIAPPSASTGNYAYEFSDPTHAQIYYTQSLAPQYAAQYQTMTSSPAVGMPNTSSQQPTEKNQATN